MGMLSVRIPRLQQLLGVYRLSLAREVLRQLRVCLGLADGPLTRRIARRHEITRWERLPPGFQALHARPGWHAMQCNA
jgi:hypothetical protein